MPYKIHSSGLRFNKDEGGRHTPFFSNYRPVLLPEQQTLQVFVCYQKSEMCMPGDNVEMIIELIHPIAMAQGLTFAIREGGRTVGSGSLLQSSSN